MSRASTWKMEELGVMPCVERDKKKVGRWWEMSEKVRKRGGRCQSKWEEPWRGRAQAPSLSSGDLGRTRKSPLGFGYLLSNEQAELDDFYSSLSSGDYNSSVIAPISPISNIGNQKKHLFSLTWAVAIKERERKRETPENFLLTFFLGLSR